MNEPEHDPADDYVSKRTLVICAIIGGLAMAVTLLVVVIIAIRVTDIQRDDIQQNKKQIRIQKKTDRQLKSAVRELRRLTNPTPEEYRKQLQEGLKRCLREPACRRLFPAIQARSIRRLLDPPSSTATPTSVPYPSSTSPSPSEGGSGVPPSRPNRQPRPGSSSQQPPSLTPTPPPPANEGPPQGERPVVITAPIPVQVCTSVAGVNCP